jgi:hypothetical protein
VITTWAGSAITTGASVGGEGKRPRSAAGRTPDQHSAKKPKAALELNEVAQFFGGIKGISAEVGRQFAQKCNHEDFNMENLREIGTQKDFKEVRQILSMVLGTEKMGPLHSVWSASQKL